MNKQIDGFLIGLIAGFAIGAATLTAALVLSNKTPSQIRETIQADAVRLGHAEWVAGSGTTPVFQWKKLP